MKKVFLSLLAIAAAGTMMAGVTPHFGLELGYDHGWAHVRTPAGYYGSSSYFFEEAQMDGFHFGGNVQLDFLEGQHKPGLVIGLNYQFLTRNLMNANPETKKTIDDFKQKAKDAGASNICTYHYAFMHTIQIPIRFQYTYQFNNDWRFFLNSGPQFRLHAAFTNEAKATCKMDGKKTGIYASQDVVSGKYVEKEWLAGELVVDKSSELDKLDRLSCFDMSWGFGIGFGWKALSLSFGYDLGMINLFNRDLNGWRYNSDALAVTIGYRIK